MNRQRHRSADLTPTLPPPPLPLTVQSAIDWVAGWSGNPVVLREISSALRAVARMAGLPPGAVVLTPDALRESVLNRSAAGHGVSLSRMRNIVADLRRVLRFADVIDPIDTPVSDLWSVLVDQLDERKRAEVNGFARFCSLRQIGPEQVNTETLRAFETQVVTRTLTPNPRKRVGSLRQFWNLTGRTVQGWPSTVLDGGRSHDFVLPVEAFSENFRADLAAFGACMAATSLDLSELSGSEESIFEGGRGGRAVKPVTRDLRMSHARWAASAAVATGVRVSDLNTLADLVIPLSRAKAILKFLYDRVEGGRSAAGMHVAGVLRIIAKYHAGLSPADGNQVVNQIKSWGRSVRLEYAGITAKNERLVREASTPERDRAILSLPNILREEAEKLLKSPPRRREAKRLITTSPREAAGLMLRAVAIGILTKTPLRLGELVGLRLDRHLQRPDPRLDRITHISLQPQDRKAPVPYSVCISAQTGELLELWIRVFQPIVSPNSVYLFPSWTKADRPMTPQGLRDAVKSTLARRVGVKLTPHTFRHLASNHLFAAFPGQFALVQSLLGHKDPTTAQRYYIGRNNEAAHKVYDELCLKRQGVQPPSRRTSKGRR